MTVTEQLIEDLRPHLERLIEKAWILGHAQGLKEKDDPQG